MLVHACAWGLSGRWRQQLRDTSLLRPKRLSFDAHYLRPLVTLLLLIMLTCADCIFFWLVTDLLRAHGHAPADSDDLDLLQLTQGAWMMSTLCMAIVTSLAAVATLIGYLLGVIISALTRLRILKDDPSPAQSRKSPQSKTFVKLPRTLEKTTEQTSKTKRRDEVTPETRDSSPDDVNAPPSPEPEVFPSDNGKDSLDRRSVRRQTSAKSGIPRLRSLRTSKSS